MYFSANPNKLKSEQVQPQLIWIRGVSLYLVVLLQTIKYYVALYFCEVYLYTQSSCSTIGDTNKFCSSILVLKHEVLF